MLRRLLTAVFVLSLFLAFSGTAFADIGKGDLKTIVKINPDNPRFNDLKKAGPEQPATKKPSSAVQKLPAEGAMLAPSPPLEYFCGNESYFGGLAYIFTIPDAWGDDLFNTRFTAEENMYCTLKTGSIIFYTDATAGNPGLKIYLWDDDGFGFPNNKLDSVEWTGPEIAAIEAAVIAGGYNAYYMHADFTTSIGAINNGGEWVFTDGEEYHVGWTTVDDGSGTSVMGCLSDDGAGPYAGDERSSENWGGFWGSMLNDWGTDYVFCMRVTRCCSEIPFTDCYTDAPITNLYYIWQAPDATWGDVEYAQAFTVDGNDTLVQVDIAVYDAGDGEFGNNDVYCTIWGDLAGAPDPATMVAQVMIPAGGYAPYPALTPFVFNLVLPGAGTYYTGFSSNGTIGVDWEFCVSSDGSDGVGGSWSDWGGGYWVDMFNGWGLDVNFYFLNRICRDPFNICGWQSTFVSPYYIWNLPDPYGDYANAQMFKPTGKRCQIQQANWWMYDDGGSLDYYTYPSEYAIYTDAGGLPGTKIAGITVNPGEYVAYPSGTYVDFTPLDVYVEGPYWFVVESFAPTWETGIITVSDGGGSGADRESAENYLGFWENMCDGWSVPCDLAFVCRAYQCCEPFDDWACKPEYDNGFATRQGSYARTGRSELSVGDSWCDLNLVWHYEDPTSGVSFAGPTVQDEYVVCTFTNHVVCFDLYTGATKWTIPFSPPQLGGSVRTTPTIDLGMVFMGGGDQQSFMAYDLYTGLQIWSRDITTVGTAGLFGATRYAPTVVLDLGGGLFGAFWTTDGGKLVGVDALTGTLLAGYPYDMGYGGWVGLCTDGTSLFAGTYSNAGEGDIFSIDAATGVLNWQLSATAGMQASVLFGAAYTGFEEGFQGGISYYSDLLYANSWCTGDHPTDGVFYIIDAASGDLAYGAATAANRVGNSTPIPDINRVYVPTFSRWATPPGGGDGVMVYNRNNGSFMFNMAHPAGYRYTAEGLLTCEESLSDYPDDQFFAFDEFGFLDIFNASTGELMWRRRNVATVGVFGGASGAIVSDSVDNVHVLFADAWGNLFNLQKGIDRPRLEMIAYNYVAAVEFGPATSLATDCGPMLTNSGCDILTITAVNADENSFGVTTPAGFAKSVSDDLMHRTGNIAEALTRDAFPKNIMLREEIPGMYTSRDEVKEIVNPSATAFPPIINGVNTPYAGQTVAPGEIVNLEIDVIQAAITRGPHPFWVQVETNDPDFFLAEPTVGPQVLVTLMGGCLIDTVTLYFGVGGANWTWANNSGRFGTGDWEDPHTFMFDGDGGSWYGGAMYYGVSQYEMACNTQDWSSGGACDGECAAMVSLQADPNWCDDACKPALLTGVDLGSMSSDGLTYTPIIGNMSCKTYIDSVQNYDLGAGWDWTNWGAPFDNSLTMGLMANARTVGALDIPELHNVVVEIHELTERNGNSITGWYVGAFHDFDLGSDTAAIDRDISCAWDYNMGSHDAMGQMKLPFGPGYEPILNCKGTTGNQGLWDWGTYWDSAYGYLSGGVGALDHQDMNAEDAQLSFSFAQHDFGPDETWSFGVASFAHWGMTDPTVGDELAPMANLVNKWCGFGRGDVNNVDGINLVDIIYLAMFINHGGAGPIPFMHMGDVDGDGVVTISDVTYMVNWYFNYGPAPVGDWAF